MRSQSRPAPRHVLAICISVVLAGMVAGAHVVGAQTNADPPDIVETRRALEDARVQSQAARSRAEQLETQASSATATADRTSQDAAAVAARIQQAEAETAEKEAQIRLIGVQSARLRANLAQRQQPLVRLTAALELLARRPIVLALFRPGSVIDTVHMRALIDSMIPEVQRRTAALRSEIARGRILQEQMRQAQVALRGEEKVLAERRLALASLETRQRLAARDVSGSADREAERALALAEQARDLGSLVDNLGKEDDLRAKLAALPGPMMRPDRPEQAAASTQLAQDAALAASPPAPPVPTPLPGYMLPLTGRLVAGFGDASQGARSRGISIATQPGAQVVAPAAGRVAFAGPYRGYGQIVILAHDDSWTSLITGMAEVNVRVGDVLVAGAPLGVAGPGRPVLTLELRHDGEPVNPLDYVRR